MNMSSSKSKKKSHKIPPSGNFPTSIYSLAHDFHLGAGKFATSGHHGLRGGKTDRGNGARTRRRSGRNYQTGLERESSGPFSQGDPSHARCAGRRASVSRRKRVLL